MTFTLTKFPEKSLPHNRDFSFTVRNKLWLLSSQAKQNSLFTVYTAFLNVPFSFQKTATMNQRNTMLLHPSVKATLLIVCAAMFQGTTTVGGATSDATGELFENNSETVSKSLLASCFRENGSLHIRSASTVVSFAGIHIQPLPGQTGNPSGKQTDSDPDRYETESDSNLSRLMEKKKR